MSSNTEAITKLQASDPTTSQHPQQGTTYTSPTNVEYLGPPPTIHQRPQNPATPTLPTRSQHQDPSTPQENPSTLPRLRIRIPPRNRRQAQRRYKPKPRHERDEPFEPLDPYRLTISLTDPILFPFKLVGAWAGQGLSNSEERLPQEVDNRLEMGLRPPRREVAPVRTETEQLRGQQRGNLSDATAHSLAPSISLPETHHPQHNTTTSPPGRATHNLVEDVPSAILPTSEIKRTWSRASGKGDSEGKGKNRLLFPSQTPETSRPDNIKNQPPPSYWAEIMRQIYRYLLLRLPSLYFNRVGRVFQEAHMSRPDLELLISRATATHAVVLAGAIVLGVGGSDITTSQGKEEGRRRILDMIPGTPGRSFGTLRNPSEREGMLDGNTGNNCGTIESGASPSPMYTPLGLQGPETSASQATTFADSIPPSEQWTVPHVPWNVARFKEEWEHFVTGLINEWKTLNILSALLLATLITVLQIQDAAQDVATRTMALLSLISALMSLIFGCIYILRFSAMRTMRKAAKWAEEARKSTSDIFWNVWVFLALPACFLAWSVIFFCVTVICLIWTTGNSEASGAPVTPSLDPASSNPGGVLNPMSGAILGPRIVETSFFVVGVVYFAMVIRTFWVWSSIGAKQLRTGEARSLDAHRLKEDIVASPPPARSVPGLGMELLPEEEESNQSLRLTDQHTDTDDKHYRRSPENKDTAPIEVVTSKDERWNKERERLIGSVSSKENIPEVVEEAAYVGTLDLESGMITEGSSDGDILLCITNATPTPTSPLDN